MTNGFYQPTRTGAGLVGTVLVWVAAWLPAAVFGVILVDLVRHGAAVVSFDFLFHAPRDAGRAGGIAPILVSTGWILLVCLAVTVPVGLGTAVLLSEYRREMGGLGRVVRRALDALAAVPSIVFGLFGNALFCIALGMGFSIASGGLTLACMVLPLFVRHAEVGLRALPADYRHAAAALGLSRAETLWRILLPAALPGLSAGLVLSLGRAAAETAALIFTSGYVDRMPGSVWDSGRAATVHIFDLALNVPGGNAHAYATALVLAGLLLVINAAAVRVAARFAPQGVLP